MIAPHLKSCICSKISNLLVGLLQGLHLIGQAVFCVCVCACIYDYVCACLRPWEGWLCKSQLAPAMPHSLSEMKDNGSLQPGNVRYTPVILMRTNTQPAVTQKLWYMIQPHLLAFFSCYKSGIISLERERAEKRKNKALIWRKSCIQPLLMQVTHSQQIAVFKIKQLTSTACVSVCVCLTVCVHWPHTAKHL